MANKASNTNEKATVNQGYQNRSLKNIKNININIKKNTLPVAEDKSGEDVYGLSRVM